MCFEDEFRRIYDSTYSVAAAQVTAKCRRTADIGDILQEVYLELYRVLKKRGTEYIRDPKAFVAKLVKQKLAHYYRKHPWQHEVYDEPDEDGCMPELADIECLSVEEIAVDHEILQWTDHYLSAKGELYRKIFHLYYRFGMTLAEIAELLGRTEADVKNKLYRTLKEIREQWKGESK